MKDDKRPEENRVKIPPLACPYNEHCEDKGNPEWCSCARYLLDKPEPSPPTEEPSQDEQEALWDEIGTLKFSEWKIVRTWIGEYEIKRRQP